MLARYPYLLFLQWLSVALALVFGFYLAWDYGLVSILLEKDKSYISSIIMVIFFLATLSAGYRVIYLSREIQKALQIEKRLRENCGEMSLQESGGVESGGQMLPDGLLYEQLYKQLMRKRCSGQSGPGNQILDNMEKMISSNHDFGWLVADMMIKLGLLGTVIGFIYMLGSIAVIENADISTIQNMLVDMSSGMRIALFTTLTGLLGGMLLGLQYHFLDQGAGRLMSLISDTIETYIDH